MELHDGQTARSISIRLVSNEEKTDGRQALFYDTNHQR